jgi:hypothetical protein
MGCGKIWRIEGQNRLETVLLVQLRRKAVSDYQYKKRIRAIPWFEPERVTPNTWLPQNHPEWIFGGKDSDLIDFGNPDAWKWFVERVGSLLNSEDIDIYRQDFNMGPLSHWRANDEPEKGEGVVQAFHRAENGNDSATFRLRGLDSNVAYVLTNLDVEGTTELRGSELLDKGLSVIIKDKPGAAIILYKKKP